ncbi:MAG: cbb3-type cytochrome c oxidase subunit 3 [Deltaproteobacteria bacterium]|nr:cbb3-type cytochrome c oxidase subunit 3 [Deltaproteobacteria bacterium]
MKEILPFIHELPTRVLLITPAFFLLFMGIAVWVYRKDRKAQYEETAHLPLEQE